MVTGNIPPVSWESFLSNFIIQVLGKYFLWRIRKSGFSCCKNFSFPQFYGPMYSWIW